MFTEIRLQRSGHAPVKKIVCTFQGKQSLPEAATHAWVLGEREKVGNSVEEFHCRGPLTTQGRTSNE
jgi:hypothetical protein